MPQNRVAPALGLSNRGNGDSSAPSIAQFPQNDNTFDLFEVRDGNDEPYGLAFSGRTLWALRLFPDAGPRGLTAFDLPRGLRLAGYVHKLRRAGLQIETEYERHEGEFPGHHARYRLKSHVRKVGEGAA